MILYVYIVYTYTYIRVCCWAKGCCGGGMMMGVYSCERGFSVVLRISSCLCLPEKYQQWIVGEFQCTGILHGFEYSSFNFAHARYPMLCIVSTLVLSRNIFPLKRIPFCFPALVPSAVGCQAVQLGKLGNRKVACEERTTRSWNHVLMCPRVCFFLIY